MGSSQRSHRSASSVLFVNVGWSEKYRRGSKVEGNHAWLNSPGYPRNGCGEEELFVPRDGLFRGPLGRGQVHAKEHDLDVVYVAHRRDQGDHWIVAVFYGVEWWPLENDTWHMCQTPDAICLDVVERVKVKEWPIGQGVRRWAKNKASSAEFVGELGFG